MSVLHKKSARLRDEERARLIWLLSTDKAVTSALLGKLTLAERYDEGTLADDWPKWKCWSRICRRRISPMRWKRFL